MYLPEADTALPVPPITHRLVHAEGVYFDLPDTEYHRALALSASGIKNLRISTLDWWVRSPLNPQQPTEEDSETFAKTLGKAYHKRILEGREAFARTYAAAVDPADHPNALRSNDELSQRCKDLGLKASGKKSDLIARILEADPEHEDVIWERIVSAHEKRHAGKIFLAHDIIEKIQISAKMIEAHPELGKAVRGGVAEASIFYVDRETGVPVKVRIDYWKPRVLVDLKTASNEVGMAIDKAVTRAIANYRLHIQAALYVEAIEHARRFIAEGRVFGRIDPALLKALGAPGEMTWMWLFQMKGLAPVARGYVLPPGMTMDIGRQEVVIAKDLFARSWATYGPDMPWVDVSEITTLDSTAFPVWIAD